MFSNILSHFKDFPTTDILFLRSALSYNPMTGEMESSYEYDYKVAAWIPEERLKGLLNEKVWDTVDKVLFIFLTKASHLHRRTSSGTINSGTR